MTDIADGLYAYRFKGFALDPNLIENFVVGVGTLRITGDDIAGEHRATVLRLAVKPAVPADKPTTPTDKPTAPADNRFTVNGKIKDWDKNSGTANLTFTQQDGDLSTRQVLTSDFAVVRASSSNEFWLTSLGKAKVTFGQSFKIDAAELVEGELRWISA